MLKDAQEKARQKDIKIKQHRIIYKLVDDMKEEIESRLPLIEIEEVLGNQYIALNVNLCTHTFCNYINILNLTVLYYVVQIFMLKM